MCLMRILLSYYAFDRCGPVSVLAEHVVPRIAMADLEHRRAHRWRRWRGHAGAETERLGESRLPGRLHRIPLWDALCSAILMGDVPLRAYGVCGHLEYLEARRAVSPVQARNRKLPGPHRGCYGASGTRPI